MQAKGANDEEVRQLIKDRMDELGVTLNDVAKQNPYLADRIKRGIVDDPTVFACVQVLGLTPYRLLSGRIPSRDELVTLLRYGKSSYPVGFPPLPPSETLSDWEKY